MVDAPGQTDARRADAPRYQPLVVVLVAVCAGVMIDRSWPLPLALWAAIALGAWAVWLVLWRRNHDRAAAVLVLTAAGATGAAWHHCCWCLFDRDDLGHFARRVAEPACVEVIALQTPRAIPPPEPDPMMPIQSGSRSRLEVELLGVRDGRHWRRAAGRVRLDVQGRLPNVQAGDRLKVFALLMQPAKFRREAIVHELLHLKVPNHGKLFRSLLRAYLGAGHSHAAGSRK